ncbi:MAG TPA: amidohydrolase family protein [Cyclobacteriaceae bacterium]|nr:amidohydrolase family protein [Cyclobacteriaceae bacterium]
MVIDAHQHFWRYSPARHGWITDEMAVIRRDFLPKELEQIYRQGDIDGCVAVQVDQNEAENEFFLAFARLHPFIKGIVGWVDIQDPKIKERLEYYSTERTIKGFRHIVQGESDPNFLLGRDFCRGVGMLNAYNFTYDILVYHYQLVQVEPFISKFPKQKFIIDHIAKPAIAKGEIKQWEKYMRSIAKHENVYCKLSGIVTEADINHWSYEDLAPYLDVVLDCFGPSRLVYGSDWPVCLVAATYEEQFGVVQKAIEKLSPAEKKQILGENAIRFYNL